MNILERNVLAEKTAALRTKVAEFIEPKISSDNETVVSPVEAVVPPPLEASMATEITQNAGIFAKQAKYMQQICNPILDDLKKIREYG